MVIVSFSFQCYPGEFSLLCGTPDIVFRETVLVLKGKLSPGLCDYPVPLGKITRTKITKNHRLLRLALNPDVI